MEKEDPIMLASAMGTITEDHRWGDHGRARWGECIVPWLLDADVMRSMAHQAMDYFETASYPVLGMANPGFRIVHELGVAAWRYWGDDRDFVSGWVPRTYFSSNSRYRGPTPPDYEGDVIDLGNTLNLADKQRGRMNARVLGEIEKPLRYAHYLVFRHTYEILVD